MCCLVEPEWEIENIEGPDSVTGVLKVLEPDARKPARPVLRGGSHGNVTFLPDNLISTIREFSGKTITTQWDYGVPDRLSKLTEAVGTPEERERHYTYTDKGLLQETIKPSGIHLTNHYDPLDRLISQTSSDGTIDTLLVRENIRLRSGSATVTRAKSWTNSINPFKEKTFQEIDQLLRSKGFAIRGPDPLNG
jgi:YD repeat-containing protein